MEEKSKRRRQTDIYESQDVVIHGSGLNTALSDGGKKSNNA